MYRAEATVRICLTNEWVPNIKTIEKRIKDLDKRFRSQSKRFWPKRRKKRDHL